MKKRLVLIIVLALLLISVGGAYAGGGPKGTYVHWTQPGPGFDCHTYWLMTGSGLVHEWRSDSACAAYGGYNALHLVFKPKSKFLSADCDDEGYLGKLDNWTANLNGYVDQVDDEADISAFITHGKSYWVCFYAWDHAELP